MHALVQGIFNEHALDGMIEDGHQTKIQENALNDNFYKKEFQTLWNYINHKWSYTVYFDSHELIQKAIRHIDEKLFVSQLQYTVTKGMQGDDWSAKTIQSGNGFVSEKSHTCDLKRSEMSQVKYDLIGEIGAGTHLTRKTVAMILKSLQLKKIRIFLRRTRPRKMCRTMYLLIEQQKNL